MARSSERHADDPAVERVIVNIDGLEELAALRDALDGIRRDIDWWINNHRPEQWLPVQPITTMPAAAVASLPNHQRNTVPSVEARTHPRATSTPEPRPHTAAGPVESCDDETQFCCDAPDLQWTGDPQFPGVACMNCGYMVADCGSVVMQPSPEADPEPKEQQRDLFAEE